MRLEQIQYRAAKLVIGALHLTSREKLNAELGWETIQKGSDILGLNIFHKIHSHETRPLIRTCMPKSFFPYQTKHWNSLSSNIQSLGIEDFKTFTKTLKPRRYKHFQNFRMFQLNTIQGGTAYKRWGLTDIL